MRIGIASDLHFGYAWGTERQEDSFTQAAEAINDCLKADVLLLPGDLFDSRIPRQEVMDKAMRIIGTASEKQSQAKVESFRSGRAVPSVTGTPVIAIHGTHERRATGLTNPVQLLEAAGLCIALHNDAVVLTRNGERVAIHGMGGVPEQYAPTVLKECAFKPLPGITNILVMHQSFREYVYEDAAFLSMDDLPPGFDLYVNGHVHWSDIKEKNGRTMLHPGSTILTQMRKVEAEQPKRAWFYDTETKSLTSQDLATPRKFYYLELEASGAPADIMAKARQMLSKVPTSNPKPLVKLKLSGSLPPGASIDLSSLVRGSEALVSIDSSLEAAQFRRNIEILRQDQARKSIDEIGLSLLQNNLDQANYSGPSAMELLPLLSSGSDEEVSKLFRRGRSP